MKEIKIGAILSYINILATFAVTILFTPFLIHNLGQEEYGLYSMMLIFIGYFSLLNFGTSNTIVRYLAKNRVTGDKEKESELNGLFLKFLIVISFLSILLGIILFLNSGDIFQNLSSKQLSTVKIALLIIGITYAIQSPLQLFYSILQAYEKFNVIYIVYIFKILIQPVILLIFLFQGTNALFLLYIVIIMNTAVLVVFALYSLLILKVKIAWKKNNSKILKGIFTYSFFIFITILIDKIYWETDQIILGIMKGTEDVAVYSIAIQFVGIFISIALAISSLFLPKITMLVTNDYDEREINYLFVKVGSIQLIIVGYVLGGFILLGREFLILWVGQEFLQVYIIVLIIMVPFSFSLIQDLGFTILKARNLLRFRTFLMLMIAIANMIISIPIIHYYGMIGTAIVTTLSLLLGHIIMNIYYYKKLNLDIFRFWKAITKIAFSIVLSIFIMRIILILNSQVINWFVFLKYIVYYSFVIVFCLYFIGIDKADRKTVKNYIKEVGYWFFKS